jgi:hypothetical protein
MRSLPTRLSSLPAVASSLLVAVAASCGGGGSDTPDASIDALPVDAPIDAAVPPVFRNPVDTASPILAQQAATILGIGDATNCDTCHALSRNRLEEWQWYTQWSEDNCLQNKAPTTPAQAMAIIDCLRPVPNKPYIPAAAGIYTTAAQLPWFEYVFRLAFGAGWQTEYDDFVARVGMPRDAAPFTQPQLDIVAEWFARGLPNLDDVLGEEPPPPPCTSDIQSDVAAHVTAMETAGWRALNGDDGLLMFGCAGASDPLACLTAYPSSSERTWAQGWTQAAPLSTIRILRTNNYPSSFWTRSSADGRFVSHGGSSTGAGSTVIDLLQNREIPANAWYDPGFFPDNSGFIIQGNGGVFCEQSLLTSSPQQITFGEPQCSPAPTVGLYQHLGAVRGGDYWTVHGQFAADDGGHGLTSSDPWADFDPGSQNYLVPLVHTGGAFVPKATIAITTPYEGDTVISPSSRLLISRIGTTQGRQNGFSMRKLIATPSGTTYTVQTPVVATYCTRGGKPAFSYDERWLIYHHVVEADDWQSLGYASATDPAFVTLRASGAANLFLLDLLTGAERRITTMAPGQYAMFPHFRSDGWIYAIVRDTNRGREDIIASNAALVYE